MMHNNQGQIVIRKATEADVRQIAEILVEDWKRAYNGIMDSAYLDAMSVEQRYPIELRRYQKYMVAADGQEILGYAWNEMIDDETADCEIVALYVRYDRRKSGIGRMLFQNAMDSFRAVGKKTMIIQNATRSGHLYSMRFLCSGLPFFCQSILRLLPPQHH